ncbi:MAG TPA: hypothetical protein PKD54_03575 [Pirellulaceae bacterium]|nr:hypothetical protein [Pirellulaceae bacterium]
MEIDESIARRFLMSELNLKRGVRKAVAERVRAGKCLIDGCDRTPVQRGLCTKHVQQFYARRRAQGDEAARLRFENKCIREGLILRPGEQERLTATDPFSQIANEAG